jgi:hypothetical protein
MNKYGCTMMSAGAVFYAQVVAEDPKQAREMAATEMNQGRPREWSVAVLEADVPGPARFLSSSNQES